MDATSGPLTDSSEARDVSAIPMTSLDRQCVGYLPRQRAESYHERLKVGRLQEKAGETVRLTRRISGIAADGEDWRLSRWRPRRAQRPEKSAAILAGHTEIDEHGVEARAGSMRQRRWGTADV